MIKLCPAPNGAGQTTNIQKEEHVKEGKKGREGKEKEKKRSYKRPEVRSEEYQERGAMSCNKMAGASPRCNANPSVS